MRKAILLSTVAALTFAAGAAVAADMPARAPVTKAPPPAVALFNWSGFYVGLQAGYLWGDNDHFNLTTGVASPFDVDGALAGGHIGVNLQNGAWVYGIEADANWSNAEGSGGPDPVISVIDTVRLRSEGSVRGRLGFAVNNVLYYATGGWAWANIRHSDSAGFAFKDTLHGWTAGAGINVAATPNLIWGLEYRYSDYGSTTGTAFDTVRDDLKGHQVTGRVSVKM